jgi:S1-C subfamily serine protease
MAQQQQGASSVEHPAGASSALPSTLEQQQQPAARTAPRWLRSAVRLTAGTLFFLAAAAAGPTRGAHAAGVQPPPVTATTAAAASPPQQQPPQVFATTSALPSNSGSNQQQPGGQAQGAGGLSAAGGGGGSIDTQPGGGGQSSGGGASASASAAAASAPQPVADDLLPAEHRVVSIFEANRPSVVNVSHVRSMHHFYTLDIGRMAVGQGSGFVWDRAGHVVVAAHTVKGASEVKVTLHDQTTATARVVGTDAATDIAVLQLALPRTRTEALRPVVLGSSVGLRIGQSVLAVGNPWGLEHTLSQVRRFGWFVGWVVGRENVYVPAFAAVTTQSIHRSKNPLIKPTPTPPPPPPGHRQRAGPRDGSRPVGAEEHGADGRGHQRRQLGGAAAGLARGWLSG